MKDRIYLSPPDLRGNEQELLQSVFISNWVAPVGPMLETFENKVAKYINIPHALALNSATAALHLGLRVMGVTEGDKVLCSTFTFVASVNPITYLGAEPILVDAEKDTWNICPGLLEKAIKTEIQKGQKPKVLILVHGYGTPAKMNEILEITKKYEIQILEDAAPALGAKYSNKYCGTFGDMAVFSFNGNKIITTSGGGMLVSKDQNKIETALHLSRQANDGSYQYKYIGYNYRMSNVLAAIGVGQMELLPEFVLKRQQNCNYYKTAFKNVEIEFLKVDSTIDPNCWLTTILFQNTEIRDKIKLALEQNNIESRFLWKPMHIQPIYKNTVAYTNGVSEDLYARGLCLPSGSSLLEKDIARVCSIVLNCFEKS